MNICHPQEQHKQETLLRKKRNQRHRAALHQPHLNRKRRAK